MARTREVVTGFTLVALVAITCLSSCRRSIRVPFPYLQGGRSYGTTVDGRPLEFAELGSGNDTVLIIATIHGNEFAGTPLVHKLQQLLLNNGDLLANRRVLLVPFANPDGYARNVRYNSHGIDLNRNFGASNRQNLARYGTSELSEPESKGLLALVDRVKPTRIVSIHQPLTCIDYDGPAEAIARNMAKYCELPVKQIGSRAGSLGSLMGVDRGIPIITLELPRNASRVSESAVWKRYGRTLLAAVTYPTPPPELEQRTPVNWILAAVVLLVVLTAFAYVMRRRSPREATSSPERSRD